MAALLDVGSLIKMKCTGTHGRVVLANGYMKCAELAIKRCSILDKIKIK